ncbi:MAG TPA: hypothetical protein VII73_02650 [Caulobacteraceae bacterium]
MVRGVIAPNRYKVLIERIFFDRYKKDAAEVPFGRHDIETTAKTLDLVLPKNVGDLLYSFRYRVAMPEAVLATQPEGKEWVIKGIGRALYSFVLVPINRIRPSAELVTIKIPDATPEIISAYALSDEQALLAKVRYNRLIDLFLGISCYSMQNHLRTTVKGVGQIEIDEVYVGIDRQGRQFIIPVQAKAGSDQLGTIQAEQDIACCAEKFPDLICRAISAQFMANEVIAIFELTVEDGEVRVVDEKHYRLVPCIEITPEDLDRYSIRS